MNKLVQFILHDAIIFSEKSIDLSSDLRQGYYERVKGGHVIIADRRNPMTLERFSCCAHQLMNTLSICIPFLSNLYIMNVIYVDDISMKLTPKQNKLNLKMTTQHHINQCTDELYWQPEMKTASDDSDVRACDHHQNQRPIMQY